MFLGKVMPLLQKRCKFGAPHLAIEAQSTASDDIERAKLVSNMCGLRALDAALNIVREAKERGRITYATLFEQFWGPFLLIPYLSLL